MTISTTSLANMEKVTAISKLTTVKKFPPMLVAPASDTPDGFYFLSSLDQACPARITFICSFQTSSEDTFEVLKQSLAKTLVLFYPLAGQLALTSEGRYVVDCSKKCVPFVEAIADCNLDEIGDLRVPDELNRSPKLLYNNDVDPNIPTTIQMTKFKCGGFTLGFATTHSLVDGAGSIQFREAWAEIARGGSPSPPFLDCTIFRARDPPIPRGPYDDFLEITDISGMESMYEREQNKAKMFTFSSEKIGAIKKAGFADGRVQGCSSFVAVAALVWKARSQAMSMKPSQLTRLGIYIEIRKRCKGIPVPENYFGNLVTLGCCTTTAGELAERPMSCTIEHIQKTIAMVDEEYIRSKIDYVHVHKPPEMSSAGTLLISSWTRLPFDSCNFGWGSPTQYGAGGHGKEYCLFYPEDEEDGGKGISVSLALPVSAMENFKELISRESMN